MQETDIIKKILNENMGHKKGESVLVVTDTDIQEVGKIFFEATMDKFIIMEPGKVHGEEPNEDVAEAMLASDIVLIITSKSLTHTKARRDACKAGARIASMPTLEKRMIQGAMNLDYKTMSARTRRLAGLLNGKKVRITTEAGTDLTMDISGRKIDIDDGMFLDRGEFGNLPAGEASLAPVEGSTNGTLVIDASFPDVLIDKPFKITVKEGYAVDIGHPLLKERLETVGMKDAFAVAELGIGTNDAARITGNVLEDEKVLGTAHVAFGNNMSYGGKQDVPVHIDCVFRKPSIEVDGRIIMENGELR